MRRGPRWFHHLWAVLGRYFWVPCPTCGRPFGGHEAAKTRYTRWDSWHHGQMVCSAACATDEPVPCRWCGESVTRAGADAEWVDADGDPCCDERVEGCPACEDGEAHNHEPAWSL